MTIRFLFGYWAMFVKTIFWFEAWLRRSSQFFICLSWIRTRDFPVARSSTKLVIISTLKLIITFAINYWSKFVQTIFWSESWLRHRTGANSNYASLGFELGTFRLQGQALSLLIQMSKNGFCNFWSVTNSEQYLL